ncbi:MAG: DUF4868 domain-containing protein [Balneola sp.]|nr:DUF4868 domain-containing protein [Balneola sp.]
MADATLTKLKNLKLDNTVATFWIVTRAYKRSEREAKYNVHSVDITDKLEKKVTSIVESSIQNSNQIIQYDYLTTDQDKESVFKIGSSETDFDQILEFIDQGSEAPKITNFNQLENAWAYVIKLQSNDFQVLGFKRIIRDMGLKTSDKFHTTIFRDHKFEDLEEEEVFRISKNLDFYYFENELFILNKKNFETGLNFREGMERKRDETLSDFEDLNVVTDTGKIREFIGDNMTYLRKISTINKNGYYKHPNFLVELERVSTAEGWGVEFDNGTLVVTDDNIELLLTVLNKDRLKDLIEGETFDVGTKKPVVLS